MDFTNVACCGVRELSGLSCHACDPVQMMKSFTRIYTGNNPYCRSNDRFRYAIFSQAGKTSKYGLKFAAFIKEHGLGELVETGFHKNPNSGNYLKAWIWTVDHIAVRAWLAKTTAAEKEMKNGQGSKDSQGPSV